MSKLNRDDNLDITVAWEVRLGAQSPGRLGLVQRTVTVSESAALARVEVARTSGSAGAVDVGYRTREGTALAGEDFAPLEGRLAWGDGDASRRTIEIPLLGDLAVEGSETFFVDLYDPSGGAVLGTQSATIRVDDDDGGDGPGSLALESRTMTVDESAGAARFVVLRSGGASGALAVSYATREVSAAAGADFEPVTGKLEWSDGDDSARFVDVPVIDDLDPERTELFELVLEGATGGVTITTASAVAAIVDDDRAPRCEPADQELCLLDERFRLELEWRDQASDDRGVAVVIPQTDQTGLFWFFDVENVELIAKVLDGRALNGSHWLFYGGITTLEFWLIATDLETGAVRIYDNPPGGQGGVNDTQAFPEGDAASTPRRGATSEPAAPATGAGGGCQGDDDLCLFAGRFRVEVAWRDPVGQREGVGVPVPFTDQTGFFWFFDEQNLELVVKVLDGRAINDRFWVFYGGLSDVEYSITVTDTETGAQRTYLNAAGEIDGDADLDAFVP